MAVYDEPTSVQFATVESEWKMAGVSFIETRRSSCPNFGGEPGGFANDGSYCACEWTDASSNSFAGRWCRAVGSTSRAGLRALDERRRSSANHEFKEWREYVSVVARRQSNNCCQPYRPQRWPT